ncbi:centromere protein W isoform X1 [Anguilla anguilla]|uniref:centromere protein W isoform X1 n=1 Tax=Anguilla anguilla TaxID=7936 RepID=UPI0015A90171|nr:centromere protein W isoform X1 [Anguilla anguilla]
MTTARSRAFQNDTVQYVILKVSNATLPAKGVGSCFLKNRVKLSNVQLSVMMFLHRLAEESRTKAFEEKSATIKPQHIKDVSKKLLKGARG